MDILSKYVVIVVLAICLCLGYIIKHSISFIPNKFIPLILAAVGVLVNVWINNWSLTPEILLGGMASGLASTGAFELIRNIAGNNLSEAKTGISGQESGLHNESIIAAKTQPSGKRISVRAVFSQLSYNVAYGIFLCLLDCLIQIRVQISVPDIFTCYFYSSSTHSDRNVITIMYNRLSV